jgi:hypothetical protein
MSTGPEAHTISLILIPSTGGHTAGQGLKELKNEDRAPESLTTGAELSVFFVYSTSGTFVGHPELYTCCKEHN